MTTYYQASFDSISSEDFVKTFTFGPHTLQMRFFFPSTCAEEVDNYTRALTARAAADTLVTRDGAYIREYNWIEFYQGIPHYNTRVVEEWMEETGIVPQSLLNLTDPSLRARVIMDRCREADELDNILRPLFDQYVWHVEITDVDTGDTETGIVVAGSWYHNNRGSWSVTFRGVPEVTRGNLGQTTVYCEVYDEQ